MTLPLIFQLMKDHQLPIAKDIEKPWFQRVWIPLTMRQMSCQSLLERSNDLIPRTMSIRTEVLNFLGYEGKEGDT